ncbi:MAG: hypothetical protein ACHQ1G_06250, partial [Planctomycetota bacterium]
MRSAALLLVALAVVAALFLVERDPPPPGPPPLAEGFAGSAACAECHPDLHARWGKTAHALTIRDFTGEESARPFDGETFVARDVEH